METEDTRYLIGTKIITYCKWLIYTAPFKDVDIESLMQIHQDFYRFERGTIRKSEGTFRRRPKAQLKIWYEKHLQSKRRKATKCYAVEDSDHELLMPGQHRVVLPDYEEEDDVGGGARSPGRGDDNESD
jgi:hypothetical protein